MSKGGDAGHGPECDGCQDGMHVVKAKYREMLRSHGWLAHYVTDLPPGEANAHTHGFVETWGHPDFQLVLPLPPEVAHTILGTLAERVKGGERFEAGQRVEKVIRNFPVVLADAVESGRPVLRILLPDKDGRFPGDPGCAPAFERQTAVDTAGG